ncbi:MAG: GHKL domain-containing protein [Chitinophagaceae bacterium]|nr:GHKL domain-containing protein [Chitinophagaceae bacterium]
MQMIRNDKNNFFSKHSYLLVAAAWLVTISFIIDNYWSGTSTIGSMQKIIQQDVQAKQKDFVSVCRDTDLLNNLIGQKYSAATLQHLVDKKYFIFVYLHTEFNGDVPVFWNTQTVQPDEAVLKADTSRLRKLSNGWYVTDKKNQKSANGNLYKIITLIPVKWDYYIQNKYLQNSFVAIDNADKKFDISFEQGQPVNSIEGKTIFYIRQLNAGIATENTIALWLRIIAALLILYLVHLYANFIVKTRGFVMGVAALVIPILFFRILSYYLPVPIHFRQLELFDPSVYGSNMVLRSLGDLLINALLFVWIILFVRYHLQEADLKISQLSTTKKNIAFAILIFIMILVTILCAHVVRSLVADSQISFDVINFFTLTRYSIIGFIVLCSLATGYFFFFQIILYVTEFINGKNPLALYVTLAVAGLILLTFRLTSPLIDFDLITLIWLLLFVYLINHDYFSLLASKLISSRFIFWIFFFSVSIMAVIVWGNRQKEISNRKHFAENLANKADPSVEIMMNSILTDLRNDYLVDVFSRFHNEKDNRFLKDSMINESFSGFMNKYDTKIYTYDGAGNALYNEDSTDLNTLNAIIETQAKPTNTQGLYFYDVSYDRFNYISKKQVTDTAGNILGTVFILSKPKSNKGDALYPELFAKGNLNSIESSPSYAFAVYNKNNLSTSHNDYPFPTVIKNFRLSNNAFIIKKINGYSELWYKANEEKIVVIAKRDSIFMECITLFAYLFCAFLLVTVILRGINLLFVSRFNFKKITELWHLTIRNQVHGTIILISALSFIIVGITTILFFIDRYHNNSREKLSRTIEVMQNEVRNKLDKFSVFDDEVKIYDLVSNQNLTQTINQIAEIHAVDMNLYDLNGDLKVSSLPLPYDKGIVSTKMDPVAFYHLSKIKDVQFFQEQQIGKLKYLSNYVPVRDANGTEYAYLNIPYFESQTDLQEEISNFLVTIINLNAFIFLIAGIIALFITNRITRSFSVITDKMKQVNLGKINEEIVWGKKDEIGDLVKEYNKMVKKLDISADLLAKSERQGAWREMAQQVAHEIKNPLTPMKLNLQYLQMAIDSNSPDVRNISVYVSKILVEQIDHLSQIAGDFAQFANIGKSNYQQFNVNDSILHMTSLYAVDNKLQIRLKLYTDDLYIMADRTEINRVLNNLLQNAVQSIPEDRTGEIEIETYLNNDMVTIKITDNGSGIPTEMHSKIFTPNFTTKTSGTGLGLAMCKGIVEKANGNIWFKTEIGKCTSFFVELPLVKPIS